MFGIYIGTSGWYYSGWSGTFYPADLSKSEWLTFYAQRFNTVEINASFYRLPFVNMIKGWRRRAPEGFVYAVKGSRRITHLKRLADVEEAVNTFSDRVSGLKDHLGPILWQLPPNLLKDRDRLDHFLAGLPQEVRHAIEFRDPSWLDNEIFEILRKRAVAQVSVSSLKMPADFTVTADFVYFRFHGLKGGYRHDYTRKELEPWLKAVRSAKRRKLDVYAYFNNDGDARAPKNAKDLLKLIGS